MSHRALNGYLQTYFFFIEHVLIFNDHNKRYRSNGGRARAKIETVKTKQLGHFVKTLYFMYLPWKSINDVFIVHYQDCEPSKLRNARFNCNSVMSIWVVEFWELKFRLCWARARLTFFLVWFVCCVLFSVSFWTCRK